MRTSRRAGLGLAAAMLALLAREAWASSPAPAAPGRVPRYTTVIQVTRSTAYLGAGRAQGLEAGSTVVLWRNGTRVATCTIDEVADHHSSCEATRALAGDIALLPEPPRPAAPRLPGPRIPPEELARLGEAVLQAEIPRVPYSGPRQPAPPRAGGVAASASGGAWDVTRSGATFVERLDVAGRGAPFPGVEGAIRAAVERWSGSSTRRFRPDDRWQLYVWEARLTRNAGAGSFVTLGRFLPRGTPGQPILDGVQAWRRVAPGTSVGLYAGGSPAALSTEPSLQYPAAGLQLASARVWGRAFETSAQARAGVAGAPDRPARAEAELSCQAGTRRADVVGSVQAAAGGGNGASIQAVRLDASSRPWDALLVSAGFRAFDPSPGDAPGLGPVAAATRRGDADLRFSVLPWLWVGGDVSAERDLSTGLERATYGPVAGTQFGKRAGVRAGWREETGWWPGRTVDLSWWYRPSRTWRLSGSLALSRWSRAANAQDLELWASASTMAALAPWLSVRASLSGTAAAFAPPAAPYRSQGGGLVGALQVEARR